MADESTMNTLSKKQAEGLRKIRPSFGHAHTIVDQIVSNVVQLCTHHDDKDCPICDLFADMHAAHELIEKAGKNLDAFLNRGPEPK